MNDTVLHHISCVPSKTALALSKIHLYSDDYHQCISRAAKAICDDYPEHRYETQYSSGATLWSKSGEEGIFVNKKGEVS